MSAKSGHEIETAAWGDYHASRGGNELLRAVTTGLDLETGERAEALVRQCFELGIAAGRQSARLDLKGRILYALMGES